MAPGTGVPKAVPLKDRSERDFAIITLGGTLLAFNGGMLNATTVSGARSLSTAPMTGTSTNIGVGLGSGDFDLVGISVGIILSNMIGAALSGFVVPNRTFYLGSPYGRIFKLGTLILAGAAIIDLMFPQSLVSYFLVSFIAGVQNAMTSRYSGNILRTTHISGSVTDIGLIAGRTLHGQNQNMWKLKINVCLVLGFFAGALVAALTQRELHNYQLFVNTVFFGLVGVCFTVFVKQEREYRSLLRWLGCLRTDPVGDAVACVAKAGEKGTGTAQAPEVESGLACAPVEVVAETSVAPGDEEGLRGPEDQSVDHIECGDQASYALVEKELAATAGEVELTLVDSGADSSPPMAAKSAVEAAPGPAASEGVQWTYRTMLAGVVCLCMNAGYINATTALSSRGLKTSHVTGTSTQLGLELVGGDLGSAGVRLTQLACYLIGAVLCGTVVSSDFYSMKSPYGRLFVLGAALLAAALVVHVLLPQSLLFYYLLTLFCGMQSAMGAKIKDTIVRTCYMSGCVADIGATLGKMLRRCEVSNATGLRSLKLLCTSLGAYVAGALTAALLHPLLGRFTILVSLICFCTLGLVHSYVSRC